MATISADDTVGESAPGSASAAQLTFDELGTPAALKYRQAIPEAYTHVIGSGIRSHDVEGVEKGVTHFMSDILRVPMATDPAAGSTPMGGAAGKTGSAGK